MNLVLIGCGNMGHSILDLLESNNSVNRVIAIDPKFNEIINSGKVLKRSTLDRTIEYNDYIFILAVKPQMKDKLSIYHDINPIGFVSIMAGINIDQINQILGNNKKIARFMPNIAIQYGKSINFAFAEDKNFLKNIDDLFHNSGKTIWVNKEEEMHFGTIFAGCAPGYIAQILSTFVGVIDDYKMNLDSRTLIIDCILSGLEIIKRQPDLSLSDIMSKVASKGGVTQEIIDGLSSKEFKEIIKILLRAVLKNL